MTPRVGQGEEELLSELLAISKMLPLFFQGPSFCITYTAAFRGVTPGKHVSTEGAGALQVGDRPTQPHDRTEMVRDSVSKPHTASDTHTQTFLLGNRRDSSANPLTASKTTDRATKDLFIPALSQIGTSKLTPSLLVLLWQFLLRRSHYKGGCSARSTKSRVNCTLGPAIYWCFSNCLRTPLL